MSLENRAVAGMILRMRWRGASWNAIADELTIAGVATRSGAPVWRVSSVRDVFLRWQKSEYAENLRARIRQ